MEFSPNKELKYSKHQHPLKYFSNLPYHWSCEVAKSGQKCRMYHLSESDYWDHPVYVCLKCEYHVCDLDAENEE